MRKKLIVSLSFALAVSSPALAQNMTYATNTTLTGSDTPRFLDEILEGAPVEEGKRLNLDQSLSTYVYDDLESSNRSDRKIDLPKGTEFEVLEISKDGRVARIGLDTEDEAMSDLFVSISDLQSVHLSEVDTTPLDEDGGRPPTRGKPGMTYCFRDVKKTLVRMGHCKRYPAGEFARDGYSILAKVCKMRQVGKVSPSSLPTGSVCVSGGGRPCGKKGACGHIAVRLPNGKWFGAGTRGTPYLPNSAKPGYKPRYVIGCLRPG